MSFKHLNQIWEIQGLTISEKLVLVRLGDMANDAGHCWPSIPKLSRATGIHERTLYYVLNSLEEMHLFERTTHRGRASDYVLTLDQYRMKKDPENVDRYGRPKKPKPEPEPEPVLTGYGFYQAHKQAALSGKLGGSKA